MVVKQTVNVTIRYSAKIADAPGSYIRLSLNETIIEDKLLLPNTDSWGTSWNEITVPIKLIPGANTIKVETMENEGLYLDEIIIE